MNSVSQRAVHLFFVGESSAMSLTLEDTFDTSLTNPNSENFKRLAGNIKTAVSIIYQLINPNFTIYNKILRSKYFIFHKN